MESFLLFPQINASYISRTPVGQNKAVTTAGLELEVNTFTFGKMRVTCVADVYKVYTTQAEIALDEEKPRLASVLGKHLYFHFIDNYVLYYREFGCSRPIAEI